jgi:hypothetical protein
MTDIVYIQCKNDVFNFGGCSDVNEVIVVLLSGTEDNSVVRLAFADLNDNFHVLEGILTCVHEPGVVIGHLHSADTSNVNCEMDRTNHTNLDDCDVDPVCCGLWKSM